MDVGHYVNSPAAEGRNSPEKREKSTSGQNNDFVCSASFKVSKICVASDSLHLLFTSSQHGDLELGQPAQHSYRRETDKHIEGEQDYNAN